MSYGEPHHPNEAKATEIAEHFGDKLIDPILQPTEPDAMNKSYFHADLISHSMVPENALCACSLKVKMKSYQPCPVF